MNRLIWLYIALFLMLSGCARGAEQTLSPTEALKIARQTDEVKALYDVQQKKWAQCIEEKVQKPCDSDWVTCIDHAWVVKFSISQHCHVNSDGRLGVTLLIDGRSGKVISHFPEVEYFRDEKYCHDDFDCLCHPNASQHQIECKNFIYAPLTWPATEIHRQAQCQKNVCIVIK